MLICNYIASFKHRLQSISETNPIREWLILHSCFCEKSTPRPKTKRLGALACQDERWYVCKPKQAQNACFWPFLVWEDEGRLMRVIHAMDGSDEFSFSLASNISTWLSNIFFCSRLDSL